SLQSYPRAARVFSTFTALPGLSTLSLHDALPILRVLAMVVEDVDVVQAQPGQGLIERAQQVLPRAAVPEGAVPHAVPGLGGDHQLVAVVAEVLLEDAAQMRLGAARGRAVVVRQIEVVHAEVEGAADDRAQGQRVTVLPEVLPEA